MEIISGLISSLMGLFRLEINLFGFELSFWQVFCFNFVASVVVYIIREVLFGGK